MFSRGPCYIVDRNLCVSWHKWILFLLLGDQFLELREALLELFFGRWILSNTANELNSVQSCLIAVVVEKLDDLIKFVKVVDLDLALLLLGEGSQSSGRRSSHQRDLICEHDTKGLDGPSLDRLLLSEGIVRDWADIQSWELSDLGVSRFQVGVQPW